jgi:hypothetical protein
MSRGSTWQWDIGEKELVACRLVDIIGNHSPELDKLVQVPVREGTRNNRRPPKGSLQPIQPLDQHRGQPLLDDATAIKVWLRKRPADGSDHLFSSQKGGKLNRTQFFRNFQTITESAGLPLEKRHPGVLKHSFASHLAAGNVNLALVR